MNLIRLNVLPPRVGKEPLQGMDRVAELVIASATTRIVKSFAASPWEVFLCPEQAARFSIYYNKPQSKNADNTKGK